ncbi:hypothetical protein D3C72_2133620 [compost metagenome]
MEQRLRDIPGHALGAPIQPGQPGDQQRQRGHAVNQVQPREAAHDGGAHPLRAAQGRLTGQKHHQGQDGQQMQGGQQGFEGHDTTPFFQNSAC